MGKPETLSNKTGSVMEFRQSPGLVPAGLFNSCLNVTAVAHAALQYGTERFFGIHRQQGKHKPLSNSSQVGKVLLFCTQT